MNSLRITTRCLAVHTAQRQPEFLQLLQRHQQKSQGKKIDILLVVNMFLTGFDSPALNTLYVDKNLRYHGLIQSYSRTNRIINELKSQGNIVAFRNLKEATDEAITLFSNKEAIEEIIMKPYDDYIKAFNQAYKHLLSIVPTVDSVNDLETEDDELEFIKAFPKPDAHHEYPDILLRFQLA
jgi:type I restriction enzyme R subunit